MDSFKRLSAAIKRYMEGIYGFDQLSGLVFGVAVVSLLFAFGGGGIFWWLLALAAISY